MADALTAPSEAAPPTPAILAAAAALEGRPRRMFDRYGWTEQLLAAGLRPGDRTVALVLAHHADPAGYLPAGGRHKLGRLAWQAGMSRDGVRRALAALQQAGFIDRPDLSGWSRRVMYPVTLTLPADAPSASPAAPAAAAAEGEEPPHTSEAAS
ncbi:helix-turn-helix domain-containing protein [Streptomyces longwoodensis]|uniref:helix-turn-helix domain-containing protein n=1 Tax=Streptomyces longwoodensis TaxID=68231 RepID=UPI00340138EE